jgi:hypothetical protein
MPKGVERQFILMRIELEDNGRGRVGRETVRGEQQAPRKEGEGSECAEKKEERLAQ